MEKFLHHTNISPRGRISNNVVFAFHRRFAGIMQLRTAQSL